MSSPRRSVGGGSIPFLLAFVGPLVFLLALAVSAGAGTYEGYYNYLWNYPSEKQDLGWNEEAQGVGHDANYWFIANNGSIVTWGDEYLWKVPVTHDLTESIAGVPGVAFFHNGSHPELLVICDHFGDPDCFRYAGHQYVLLPFDDATEDMAEFPYPGVVVLESHDDPSVLEYKGFGLLSDEQGLASFVTVNPRDSCLYSAGSAVGPMRRYGIDWEQVDAGVIEFELLETFWVYDGDGGGPLWVDFMQGGEFSPSGELLFLSSGRGSEFVDWWGISVFRSSDWHMVAHSAPVLPFEFVYDPGSPPDDWEEPQGLTIWDLDDGRAPGIIGQLHVILLDNDWPSADDIFFKHYTNRIFVDHRCAQVPPGEQHGTPLWPFSTVARAAAYAWPGSRLSIYQGSYDESVIVDVETMLLPAPGPVVIGQ